MRGVMSWKPVTPSCSREDEAAAEPVVGKDAVLALGEPAPRVLVSQRALQREAAVRPLILHVEAVVARAVALDVRADAHRELSVGVAVVERVGQLVVHVLDLPVHLVGRLVADLEAVGAGHVGHRRPPDVVLLIVGRGRRPATVGEVRDGDAGRRALLGDGDETRLRPGRNVAAPLAAERRDAGLEQQAVRHRRRPRRLRDLFPLRPHVAGLGRRGRGAERDPVVAAVAAPIALVDERRPGAVRLVFPVEPHLVLRCELAGQADRFDLLGPRRPRLDVRILHVVPLRGVEGVRVGIETWNVLVRPVAAQVVEEPQPVALDRTADREVRVPVLDQSRRLRDADTRATRRRGCCPATTRPPC